MQINGKVRGRLEIPADLTREGAEAYFAANADVQKLLGGKAVRKLIFRAGAAGEHRLLTAEGT